jgi:hypothetical protein
MRQRMLGMVFALSLTISSGAGLRAQQESSKSDSAARVAELKQSIAANRAQLQQYQWLESTDTIVKGETKKEKDQMCHYGPDGKVVKTPVNDTQGTPEKQLPTRGIRGRIVAKKVDEMKDYTERVKSLIGHYVPPDPDAIQSVQQAGNASSNLAGGMATITLANYYKPGDKVTIGFDPQAKKLRSYNVATYLDDPVKDVITLSNTFASLPDGTNHLEQTVLDMKAKQIQIKSTNSGYSKVN